MLSKLAPSAAAFVLLVAAACGTKSDAGAGGAASGDVSQYVGAQQASANADPTGGDQSGPSAAIAKIDPCALLTREEIIGQLEASYPPDQLAGFKSRNGKWQINPNPEQRGTAKLCEYRFIATVQNGDTTHHSEFTLAVVEGAFVNPNLNQAGKRPIPGIGDEAYFMSRGPMMPYARVGSVGVGIEGFPGTPTDKAGVGLLRIAVGRVR